MMKLLIAIVLFAHGIGHVLFLAPTLRIAQWADQTGDSWILRPVVGDAIGRAFGAAVWLGAIALTLGAVVGLMIGADWWRAAAVAGAVVSAVGILAMWGGILPSSALLALAFDAIVLVALLWAHWPSAELAGS